MHNLQVTPATSLFNVTLRYRDGRRCITPELEATWEPSTYQGISTWGHTPTGQNVATLMTRFQAAVRSLRAREQTVPALSSVPRGAHR